MNDDGLIGITTAGCNKLGFCECGEQYQGALSHRTAHDQSDFPPGNETRASISTKEATSLPARIRKQGGCGSQTPPTDLHSFHNQVERHALQPPQQSGLSSSCLTRSSRQRHFLQFQAPMLRNRHARTCSRKGSSNTARTKANHHIKLTSVRRNRARV
jgi:hypothetical protein